jgi:hypothetical protein
VQWNEQLISTINSQDGLLTLYQHPIVEEAIQTTVQLENELSNKELILSQWKIKKYPYPKLKNRKEYEHIVETMMETKRLLVRWKEEINWRKQESREFYQMQERWTLWCIQTLNVYPYLT